MNLGRWNRAQWLRVLPRIEDVVPRPGALPHRVAAVLSEIDGALAVFLVGGGSWRVTWHLALARRQIRGVPGDGNPAYAVAGRDLRPGLLNLMREVQELLEVLVQGDRDDMRWRLLNAAERDVREVDSGLSRVGPGFDGLVSALRADPRTWDVRWKVSGGTGRVWLRCLAGDHADMQAMVTRSGPAWSGAPGAGGLQVVF